MAVMPWLVPMVIIGPTAANVTPCISGSRTPNRQKSDRLDQRGDAGHEQVGHDEVDDVALFELAGADHRAADDERNRHRARVHREDMLQAEQGTV